MPCADSVAFYTVLSVVVLVGFVGACGVALYLRCVKLKSRNAASQSGSDERGTRSVSRLKHIHSAKKMKAGPTDGALKPKNRLRAFNDWRSENRSELRQLGETISVVG